MRRGLCVVVDYADVGLEDYAGPGMNDLSDVDAQLREMEAHWNWLSRGRESTAWDVVRVQLATTLAGTTFSGWPAFRDEVVRLTKQQVDVADYDVDSDGVLDGMWAILASQGTIPDYAVGGTSQNGGANLFVDVQHSTSIVGHVTGNFNHELAHALGIQDLYGTYDTLYDLTVMASSWPLPPNDFTAYERVRLGWVEPVTLDQTTTGVVVPSADDHLFAVRVPTARPEEYFLLEYRRRPASGYGSAGSFAYDGLAVLHVFEASTQGTDPPLVKLEPADGTTAASHAPEVDDLAFPDNPGLLRPFVLRTYFGGDPVFSIDGLHFTTDGALAFDLTILSSGMGSASNLVTNPDVESDASGWSTSAWMPAAASFAWTPSGANGSSHGLSIEAATENDAQWSTPVTGLVPNASSYVCGFLEGENVTGGAGATLSLSGTFVSTPGLYGTFPWTRRCMIVQSTSSSVDVACRLGGFGATTSGRMTCDQVSLFPLESAFGAWP
ncbi:MAG: hypothetical protein U0230_20470 [Polyangiales bacterium]